jgi:hypothetical protein
MVTRYVSGNWGVTLIAGFLLFLIAAASMLAYSNYCLEQGRILDAQTTATWAEDAAFAAYIALAIGVVFELGNVNSKTALNSITRIKKLKTALILVRSGKNKMKNGAAS